MINKNMTFLRIMTAMLRTFYDAVKGFPAVFSTHCVLPQVLCGHSWQTTTPRSCANAITPRVEQIMIRASTRLRVLLVFPCIQSSMSNAFWPIGLTFFPNDKNSPYQPARAMRYGDNRLYPIPLAVFACNYIIAKTPRTLHDG